MFQFESSDEYVICPHCGAQYGDCWEWVQGNEVVEEKTCDDCGKTFTYWAEHSVEYVSEADVEEEDISESDVEEEDISEPDDSRSEP